MEDVQDIRERLIRIETLLETNRENVEDKLNVANHRIADLENTVSWLWRTTLVGLASAIVSILLKFL